MSPTALKPSRCRVRFVASEGERSSAEVTAEHVITNLMDIAEDDNTVIVGYMRKNLLPVYALLEQGRKLSGFDMMTTLIALVPTIAHAAPMMSCALSEEDTKRSLVVSSMIVSNSGTHKDTLFFGANLLRDFAAGVLAKRGAGEYAKG